MIVKDPLFRKKKIRDREPGLRETMPEKIDFAGSTALVVAFGNEQGYYYPITKKN